MKPSLLCLGAVWGIMFIVIPAYLLGASWKIGWSLVVIQLFMILCQFTFLRRGQ